MKTQTYESVINTLEVLEASEYVVRLIHDSKPPINKRIEGNQLMKEIPYYRAKNLEGYNVYFRPVGYQFVLLDDLSRDALPELAKIKPCLLIETSPKNYQAWLKLREVPVDRDRAVIVCKELATILGADKGSAEPDHIGRLPGFTNRKPKHQRTDGLYPFVKLHKWENRESPFSPLGGIVGQNRPMVKPLPNSKTNDRSREDFNLCCMLINQGKTDDYIRRELEQRSSKAREVSRSFDYIGKTISNARTKMGRYA